MTDEQKNRFAALQGAWLAVREKRRRAEMAAELDAVMRAELSRRLCCLMRSPSFGVGLSVIECF